MRATTLAFIALCGTALADEKNPPLLQSLNYTERLSYEQFSLRNNQPDIGVLGLHNLVNITPYWYAGIGMYGSIKGNSGGYFALSLDAGFQHPLYKKLWIDIGNSLGAGGGRDTPVGGGLFLEPYAGLSLHLKHIQLGASYNYTTFTSGGIHDHHWAVNLGIPTSSDYTSPRYDNANINSAYKIALSQNYFALLASAYFPKKGTRDTSGQVNDSTIQFVGAEVGHYFNPNWFAYAQAKGAYHGRSNGYADALLGAGYRMPLTDNHQLNAILKLGMGSGGGGAVDTAGGFVIQPQLGLEYRFNPHISIEADGGYLSAPTGDFNNATAMLLLKYYFDQAHIDNQATDAVGPLHYQNWRIRLLHQTYFSPRAVNGSTNPTMQLINLDFDHAINRTFYLTGQTAFAYHGQRTGGYFSGLIGIGGQWPAPRAHQWSLFAEGLVGTAGGAGLDIGNGALYEPVVGINYQISRYWGLQTSVGRLMAFKGKFSSTVLNAGLTLSFATLNGD